MPQPSVPRSVSPWTGTAETLAMASQKTVRTMASQKHALAKSSRVRALAIASLASVLSIVCTATTPAFAQPPAPEPPLDIRADNMTGSRGPEGDIILLNGNLKVVRGRAILTSDAGRYLRAQGLLFLEGRVKMVDSTTTLTCDRATFLENEDLIQLDGNVVVRDRDAELKAPYGTYDRRRGRAELTGRVHGRDREQRLDSDRAIYWRDSLVVQARGNVQGFDEANKTELDADSVDFDRRTREAVAMGHPRLRSQGDKGRVTTMTAQHMRVNTESRLAQAMDSVLVVSDTLRARADYALFDDRAERGWLFGSPRVWDDETVVTGDTIEVWSQKRVVRRVVVRNRAVMDYRGDRPTTLGETSRLTGDRVDVFFTDQDIDSLIAIGAARNEYGAPTRIGKSQERNLALGDTITVFFKDRKIDRARVQGQAKGEFRPAVDIADTTAQRRELVSYDALRIEYVVPKNRIVLDQGAHLTYGDLELRSRRVEYDVDAQTLVAEGKPELKDRGDQVTGHLMTYDLESRVGTIYQAETAYEKGLYHGERIRKVGNNELDVMGGSYSTCDLVQPHYHFAARWMKIYLKDKLVAKPVVFYIKNVPLLALPFYVFPIKPGRHSGFLFPQFEFGFSNTAGQFIRNAGYYWAPNDYMDFTMSGDYYQAEPSWVIRAESEYKLLYVLDGQFKTSFARNDRTERDDWDFYGEHNQELTPRTRLAARGSFVSSRDYSASNLYGASLSQRVNRFLTSNLAVSHSADWASFNTFIDRRQDLDADAALQDPDGNGPSPLPAVGKLADLANLTETRPSLSVSFPTRTLGSLSAFKGTPFEKSLRTLYASLSARFVEQYERRAFVKSRDSSSAVVTNVLGQSNTTRRGFAARRRALGLAPPVRLDQLRATRERERGGVRLRRAGPSRGAGRGLEHRREHRHHVLRHVRAAPGTAGRPAPRGEPERLLQLLAGVQDPHVQRQHRRPPQPVQQLRGHRHLGLPRGQHVVLARPALPGQAAQGLRRAAPRQPAVVDDLGQLRLPVARARLQAPAVAAQLEHQPAAARRVQREPGVDHRPVPGPAGPRHDQLPRLQRRQPAGPVVQPRPAARGQAVGRRGAGHRIPRHLDAGAGVLLRRRLQLRAALDRSAERERGRALPVQPRLGGGLVGVVRHHLPHADDPAVLDPAGPALLDGDLLAHVLPGRRGGVLLPHRDQGPEGDLPRARHPRGQHRRHPVRSRGAPSSARWIPQARSAAGPSASEWALGVRSRAARARGRRTPTCRSSR